MSVERQRDKPTERRWTGDEMVTALVTIWAWSFLLYLVLIRL